MSLCQSRLEKNAREKSISRRQLQRTKKRKQQINEVKQHTTHE